MRCFVPWVHPFAPTAGSPFSLKKKKSICFYRSGWMWLRRVSEIENGSGEKWPWINKCAAALLFGRVNWCCPFMAVLLPFLLFCSSWMDQALHRYRFNTAESVRYFVSLPSRGWFEWNLFYRYARTELKSFLQLNFMLSRTSDMFLLQIQTVPLCPFGSFSSCLSNAVLPGSDS